MNHDYIGSLGCIPNEPKKWVRLKKKREYVTYELLFQHAKEHEMMVKDFNRHKSNGGTVIATTVDEIKPLSTRKVMVTEQKAQVRHAINAAHWTH